MLAIVGSSTDLLPLAERSYSMDLLVPTSGALLWADVWVVPAGAKGGHLQTGPSPILPSWLEFCTQPARAGSLNGLRWVEEGWVACMRVKGLCVSARHRRGNLSCVSVLLLLLWP